MSVHRCSDRAPRRGAWPDERGAIVTEYAVVAATCAIVMAVALASLGAPLLASYQASRHTLIAPEP
jgi:Flp pilus assembly pilin Flp